MAEDKKDKDGQGGFKVSDKRHFTNEGDVIAGGTEAEETPHVKEPSGEPAPQAAPEGPERTGPEEAAADEPRGEEPPTGGGEKVDFAHLVMSLAGTAYHSMGMPDPVTKEKGTVNLPAAGQMIDLLAVLDEKTRGNLSPQEEQILKGVLTELRSLYVQASGFAR